VQNIQNFDGGQLKLTTANFYRTSGKNMNKPGPLDKENNYWGVTPDKDCTVTLTAKERDELNDHLQDLTIIRRDQQTAKPESGFTDRQLKLALEKMRATLK
jgi:hypothetical protein